MIVYLFFIIFVSMTKESEGNHIMMVVTKENSTVIFYTKATPVLTVDIISPISPFTKRAWCSDENEYIIEGSQAGNEGTGTVDKNLNASDVMHFKIPKPRNSTWFCKFTGYSEEHAYIQRNYNITIVVYDRHFSTNDIGSSNVTTTATDVTSTATNVTSTATNFTPTATNVTSTATNVTSTSKNVTSTATNVTSTATNVTSTATNVTSTATNVTSTATNFTPTATNVTSTATNVTSTSKNVTSTATNVTSTATNVTSTATNVTSTATNFSPTTTNVTSTATNVASTVTNLTSMTANVMSTATNSKDKKRGADILQPSMSPSELVNVIFVGPALLVIGLLICGLLYYRKQVKMNEIPDNIKSRAPMELPSEVIYETAYSHIAGYQQPMDKQQIDVTGYQQLMEEQ